MAEVGDLREAGLIKSRIESFQVLIYEIFLSVLSQVVELVTS